MAFCVFLAVYFLLTGWCGWTAWSILRDGIPVGAFLGAGLKSLPLLFIFGLLVRGLFLGLGGRGEDALEITAADEPALFDFLHQLADEAGIALPHRVFLTEEVAASTGYRWSLRELFFRPKNTLTIGVGLVNALSLSEFKAVIAHEFGHAALRSKAVVRWATLGAQIGLTMYAQESAFHRALERLCDSGYGIDWIGLAMRLPVWAIRTVLGAPYWLVNLAHLAFSRQQELQADRVAVSLAGSDALVHALHKLPAAEDAMRRATGFGYVELENGGAVEDLYAMQSRICEWVRRINDDPHYGVAPPLPKQSPDIHRVFPDGFTEPPGTWSSHPLGRDREDNAKDRYVQADEDARSAWLLFRDATATRTRMTKRALASLREEPGEHTVPTAAAFKRIDERFGRTHYHGRYRGLYVGRATTRAARSVEELYLPDAEPVRLEFDHLYPEALFAEVQHWRALEGELRSLEAFRDRSLRTLGGMLRHRYKDVRSRGLNERISQVKEERNVSRERLYQRDRACRSAHDRAALRLDGQWSICLRSLVALLHYAEHGEAALGDARVQIHNVSFVVDDLERLADSSRLLEASHDVRTTVEEVYVQRTAVELPARILECLEIESWAEALGEREPPEFDDEDLRAWFAAVDSWLDDAQTLFDRLCRDVADELLDIEHRIYRLTQGEATEEADAFDVLRPAQVPDPRVVLRADDERELRPRLGFWPRFYTAQDVLGGLVPLTMAIAVLAMVVGLTACPMTISVVVYNGLNAPVRVSIGEESVEVGGHQRVEVELELSDPLLIKTVTEDGRLIETFEVEVDNIYAQQVYNVASASPLFELTVGSGSGAPETEPRLLGSPRWSTTEADFVLEAPPSSLQTKNESTTRTHLKSMAGEPPRVQEKLLGEAVNSDALVLTHARYDIAGRRAWVQWMNLATGRAGFDEVLAERLRELPDSVFLQRHAIDAAQGAERELLCQRQRERSAKSADAQYLAVRCLEDRARREAAYFAGHASHAKHPWFAWAAANTFVQQAAWNEAIVALKVARREGTLREDATIVLIQALRVVEGAATRSITPLLSSLLDRDYVASERDQKSPYFPLGRGDLARAVAAAPEAERDRVLRLAAASDGASAALKKKAAELPIGRGLELSTMWSAYALAKRDGHKTHAAWLRDHISERNPDAEVSDLLRWADEESLLQHRDELEDQLKTLTPGHRGLARVMGLIVLGDRAPAHWRNEALGLLFAHQRPYFKPAAANGDGAASPATQ